MEEKKENLPAIVLVSVNRRTKRTISNILLTSTIKAQIIFYKFREKYLSLSE